MTKSIENSSNVLPFFSHDIAARFDKDIIKLIISLGWEGYGLYWGIVEFMHRNDFPVEDESVVAYDLRVDKKIIHSIMNDFGLFRIQTESNKDYYISDRILRNLEYKENKSKQNQDAANSRWLLSSFDKEYKKIFNIEPTLSVEEIEQLKKYNNQITNLKEILPDILYSLKNLEFDTNINFKPCANWLLAKGKNNLGRLLNGEFGKLKHKKTDKEKKEEEQAKAAAKEEEEKPTAIETQIAAIYNKIDAIELIANKNKTKTIIPAFRQLMKKFDITNKELEEYKRNGKKL